ncbi:MAG: NAD-dependent epimerase/dehydratase family protein [Myxococcota bacterium]
MRVFVTGGSGFVGGHVIEALSRSHEVLAMARSAKSAEVVERLGARAVRTDLDRIDASVLAGVDVVVHSAAYVEEWGPEEAYWSANVGGTDRMLEAARAAGVKRFVLVSTNATVFDGKGQLGVDETLAAPVHDRFPYGASKAEAERRVLAANTDGFTTIAVRPCFVWGPRDNSVLPALRRMVSEGSFVWLDQGRAQVSTTHVDNLVHAIECALTGGRGGQAYFVADDGDTDIRGFISGLAESDGLVLPGRSVPSWLVRGLARTLETTWRLLGLKGTPPVTLMAARLMSSDMTVRSDKARAELGWAPVVDRVGGLAAMAA